jgi:hypothetical protein
MRGTVAKRIRATHQNTGAATHTKKYFQGSNGMILADRDRRVYQMRKARYNTTGVG